NIMDHVEPIQKKAEAVVAVLDSVLSSINNTIDKNFQHDFKRSIESIANTLQTIEHTTKQVDGLVGTEKSRIGNILANIESISANFKNNNEQITGILDHMDQFTDQLAKANFLQTLDNANKAVADLHAVVNNVQSGNGSVGKLLYDEGRYDNLNSPSRHPHALMPDLRGR